MTSMTDGDAEVAAEKVIVAVTAIDGIVAATEIGIVNAVSKHRRTSTGTFIQNYLL